MAKLVLLLVVLAACAALAAGQSAGVQLQTLVNNIRYRVYKGTYSRKHARDTLSACSGGAGNARAAVNSCADEAAALAKEGIRSVLVKFGTCGLGYTAESTYKAFLDALKCANSNYAV